MIRRFTNLPFTIPGLAVFIIALVILVRSLSTRNAYEIILSAAALLLWIVLYIAGVWGARRLGALEPLWKPPLPMTAASKENWLVTCPAPKLPWFFRLHFLVRGRFYPQGCFGEAGCPVFAETSMPRRGDTASLSLCFPLGGVFRGNGFCRLRDVFGFFSFPCALAREQTLKVRSAPCAVKALWIEAMSGAEDRRNKSSTDEERYYMREYAPGDRLRDINWKSSEKIDTLITRISPDNQEKVTRIEVYFRNYGPLNAGIGDYWLLDRAKARLAWFLRAVKEEKASFVFHIRAASGDWELKDEDEIDAFLDELASLSFSPAHNEDSGPTETGEIYVFSTACDAALPAFLLARRGSPVSLFLAQPPVFRPPGKTSRLLETFKKNKKPHRNKEFFVKNSSSLCETPSYPKDSSTPWLNSYSANNSGLSGEHACLHLRDFPAGGSVPPINWFFPWQRRQLNSGGGRVMIDYAEIKL